MQQILVIEDEQSLAEMIQLNLELEGYAVHVLSNGKQALAHKEQLANYQLVLLDVMLPEVSGLDICRAYRQVSDVPILFLSAKGTTIDRIAGLKLGANDYLAKPFDLEELLLRARILMHVNQRENEAITEITIGEVTIHFSSYEAIHVVTGEKQLLSKREIELLQFFIQHKDEVVSRDLLLEKLWNNEHAPTGRTIDNYILNFRKLLEKDPKEPQYFHSVRGVGYKFTLPE
jgi:two-component system alkaline phosphatase synthesis response regulator PhoP